VHRPAGLALGAGDGIGDVEVRVHVRRIAVLRELHRAAHADAGAGGVDGALVVEVRPRPGAGDDGDGEVEAGRSLRVIEAHLVTGVVGDLQVIAGGAAGLPRGVQRRRALPAAARSALDAADHA